MKKSSQYSNYVCRYYDDNEKCFKFVTLREKDMKQAKTDCIHIFGNCYEVKYNGKNYKA